MTQADYTLLRDYLISQIMIDNANRAGVVAYMTVQEFQRARPQDDKHVVRVLKHECHQNRKEISGNLADLMAHRESTAEKYYRVFDKSRSSVKASQVLHGMMRNEEKSNEKR